jgi:hypothetical protein
MPSVAGLIVAGEVIKDILEYGATAGAEPDTVTGTEVFAATVSGGGTQS